MKYKLYKTSLKAWDAMLNAIDQAQKSIYLEIYIFIDDTSESHDFIGKLAEKAREGIQVVIVADAFGSNSMKRESIEKLRSSGVELIFFSHWLRHIHRKILIVDEKIAFIGGVNIGRRFASWSDLQLELQGRIIRKILKSFAYTYAMSGGKNYEIIKHRDEKIGYKLKFWLIEHWPIKNIFTLKRHYVSEITKAEKCIQIATPYFMPPRWLISLLDDAVRRNVRVEIIIPQKVDWRIMDRINYYYMHKLYHSGIHLYLFQKMNHSKLLLIDGKEGLVGSQNIDLLSFQINAEAGLFFTDQKLIAELSEIIQEWKDDSTSFSPHQHKLKIADYIVLIILKIARPIL